ncbi:hypothetical protein R4446_01670 [Acinetobacter baumannii]|nr:hypothetical protein [Acinetobacter baumannii]
MPTAKSVKKEGEIDLITFVGNIFKYNEFDFDRELEAIRKSTYDDYLREISDSYYNFVRASDFRSLIIHEQTHLLDLTATLWGVEYNIRKIRVLEETTEERVSVFKLNYSELQCIHKEYAIEIKNFNYKDVVDFKHEYEFSDKFGVLLFIILIDKKGQRRRIPLTMLSLFEGHAFANEQLRKINDIKLISNKNFKDKFIKLIESDYYSYINDPNNHEYNILIMLATIHMERFGLNRKQILYFFSAISGFILNISSIGLSVLSSRVLEFVNSELKYCIRADLCRNQLRHFLAFYTILRTYEYLNHRSNVTKKKDLIRMLKIQPLTLIGLVWNGFSGGNLSNYNPLDDFDIDIHLSRFNNCAYLKTKEIFSKSKENYFNFKSQGYVLLDLSDYYLLDMYRDYDNYEIKPKNKTIIFDKRFNIDIENYFEDDSEHIELSCLVDNDVFINSQKFHLSLMDAILLNLDVDYQRMINPNTVGVIPFY